MNIQAFNNQSTIFSKKAYVKKSSTFPIPQDSFKFRFSGQKDISQETIKHPLVPVEPGRSFYSLYASSEHSLQQAETEYNRKKKEEYEPMSKLHKEYKNYLDSTEGRKWLTSIGVEIVATVVTLGGHLLIPGLTTYLTKKTLDTLQMKTGVRWEIAKQAIAKGDARSLEEIDKEMQFESITTQLKLDTGKVLKEKLSGLDIKFQNASSADVLSSEDFKSIFDGFISPCKDIQQQHQAIWKTLGQLPGFQEALSNAIDNEKLPNDFESNYELLDSSEDPEAAYLDKTFEQKQEMLIELESLLHKSNTPSEAIQALSRDVSGIEGFEKQRIALRRLYKLEAESSGHLPISLSIYSKLASDAKDAIQVEALRGLIQEPRIRTNDYGSLLIDFLRSSNTDKKYAAIQGLLQEKPVHSYSIDLELERIIANKERYEDDLRHQADTLLAKRQKSGAYKAFSPLEISENVTQIMGAKPGFKFQLAGWLTQYKTNLEKVDTRTANLSFYLTGKKGIGKTSFVNALANSAFGPENLIEVDFSKIKTLKEVKNILSKKDSFAGKVLYFNHFDNLKHLADSKERDAICSFLSPILGFEPRTDYDFSDAIVALSAEEPIDEIVEFTTKIAKPMVNRLVNYSIPVELPGA